MQVFTYHENIESDKENPILGVWAYSWRQNGFEPIILKENDARKHPLYEKFSSKIKSFPSVNFPGFDYHCFMRYLAVCSSNNDIILSVEPDVINYTLTPKIVLKEMLQDELVQYSSIPALHIGPKIGYERLCEQILNHELSDKDNHNGIPHISDQEFIARYKVIKVLPATKYLQEVFQPNFLETNLVHFCTRFMRENKHNKEYMPKHLHIDEIRKLS